MIGSLNSIQATAEKLSIPQLQQAMRDGTLPPYVGIPLLQKKVQMQKQMQIASQVQQPKKPSIAEQVNQEATADEMMRQRARMMQAEMGQTGGISDFLPKGEESYAKGGPIAFADRGLVPEPLYQNDLDIDEAHALRALSPEQRKYYSMFPNGKELAIKHGMQELSKQPEAIVGPSDARPRVSDYTKNVPYYRTEAPQPKDPLRMSLEDFVNRKGAPIPEWYTEGGKYVDRAGGVLGDYAGKVSDYVDKSGDYLTRKGVAGTAIDASKKAYLSGKNVIQGAGEGLSEGYKYAAPIANKILWGTEGQAVPQAPDAYVGASERVAPIIQTQSPVTPATLSTPAMQGGTDQRSMVERMQLRGTQDKAPPVMGGIAPAPTQTPYTQAVQATPVEQAPAPQVAPETMLSATERAKLFKEALGEDVGRADTMKRLAEREAATAKQEERAPWLGLMQAGLATMAGTSPFAMANIGAGGVAGLNAYMKAQDKLDTAKENHDAILAQLNKAQRAEDVAAYKFGADSEQADKALAAREKLQDKELASREKMNREDNAVREKVAGMQVAGSIERAGLIHSGAGGIDNQSRADRLQNTRLNSMLNATKASIANMRSGAKANGTLDLLEKDPEYIALLNDLKSIQNTLKAKAIPNASPAVSEATQTPTIPKSGTTSSGNTYRVLED